MGGETIHGHTKQQNPKKTRWKRLNLLFQQHLRYIKVPAQRKTSEQEVKGFCNGWSLSQITWDSKGSATRWIKKVIKEIDRPFSLIAIGNWYVITSDTYTHFGSGDPQSAQNLLPDSLSSLCSLCRGPDKHNTGVLETLTSCESDYICKSSLFNHVKYALNPTNLTA